MRSADDFEDRLHNEIIVDAYGPEEQAMSWYYYLDEHLQFPFKALCVAARPTTPLEVGEQVHVRGMPAEELCEHEMFVKVAWHDRDLAVPLAQLAGVDVDEETLQAIQDWHAWVERGYQL